MKTNQKSIKRPEYWATIIMPDDSILSVPVMEGETLKDVIEKFHERWWAYQAKQNPELFDENNRLKSCPKCGGKLTPHHKYCRTYFQCSNHPRCKFIKFEF